MEKLNKTWVFGDIHGSYKGLNQIFEKASISKGDTIISLGDIADGYSQVPECVQLLLDMQKDYNMIFIRGNHDEWCFDWMRFGSAHNIWINQGGKSTKEAYEINFHLKDTHCFEFFARQVNYYIDDQNRGFVHGGYTSNEGLGHESTQAEYYWDRDLFSTAMSGARSYALGNAELPKQLRAHKEIFIGHTSTINWGTTSPINACNVWNLDTGAGWGGVATIMNVDTKEFFQSDLSKDLYSNENGR
jgi:serine/threonine protein phosphatase 1